MGPARDTLVALQGRFPDAEVQTDKIEAKMVECRGCHRPLLVNRFYSAGQASCAECDLPRGFQAAEVGGGVISSAVLEELAVRYPECTCGIPAGLPVANLRNWGAGCTGSLVRTVELPSGATVRFGHDDKNRGGFVCPSLDTMRRRVA